MLVVTKTTCPMSGTCEFGVTTIRIHAHGYINIFEANRRATIGAEEGGGRGVDESENDLTLSCHGNSCHVTPQEAQWSSFLLLFLVALM